MIAAFDVAIIGGGAAGLATAIFAARGKPGLRIGVLDGAPRLGAKILVSGGGRCNVTNEHVTERDFWGTSRNTIRNVLRALPVEATIDFFREIGVPLHLEARGKYFPDTNRARSVLDALLGECARLDVGVVTGFRVASIARGDEAASRARFVIRATDKREVVAANAVLATGGLSLPKTGSDGGGYELALGLGHTIVPCTPALTPLVLDGDFHAPLAGVSHDVELTLHATGRKPERISGPMLWTHFGISGPAAMDASRIWHRARLERLDPRLTASLIPGETRESMERRFVAAAASSASASARAVLSPPLPARLADAVLESVGVGEIALAHMAREQRNALIAAILAWPLRVRDSRGYAHAEVTAGGVPLSEIDPATMQSRRTAGLYLVGEILDADGRIGGFNFQWAWSTGFIAGRAIARGVLRPAALPD